MVIFFISKLTIIYIRQKKDCKEINFKNAAVSSKILFVQAPECSKPSIAGPYFFAPCIMPILS